MFQMSVHGFVSLGEEATYLSKTKLPNPNYIPADRDAINADAPLIAPYYASSDIVDAGIYYRVINPMQETGIKQEIATEMLNRIYLDVRFAIGGAADFIPKYAIVATWEKIQFDACHGDVIPCPVCFYIINLIFYEARSTFAEV